MSGRILQIHNFKKIEKEINDRLKRCKGSKANPCGPIVSWYGLAGTGHWTPNLHYLNFDRIEIDFYDMHFFTIHFYVGDLETGSFPFDTSFTGEHRNVYFFFHSDDLAEGEKMISLSSGICAGKEVYLKQGWVAKWLRRLIWRDRGSED
ncbi:MAG TPA: hypothetical protein GX707_15705 [Epulopiscium sp.]|nr:hypothetical protein [Candidatus Epulonipiscium sp.]